MFRQTLRTCSCFSLRQCYAAIFNMPMQNIKSSKGGSPQGCKLAQKKSSTSLICHKRLRKAPWQHLPGLPLAFSWLPTPGAQIGGGFLQQPAMGTWQWGNPLGIDDEFPTKKPPWPDEISHGHRLTDGITSYTSTRKEV